MFAARRFIARAPAPLLRTTTTTPIATRQLSSSALRWAAGPPVIQGEGTKSGDVSSDLDQATGLERFEILGRLQGVDVFDMKPLQMTHLGTVSNPIKVKSLYPSRIVGCTGFPADSHDTIYLHLNRDIKSHRCPECGSVYELDFIGEEDAEHH